MNLTDKAKSVLQAAATRDGIGANCIADILGINCGRMTAMRAGQYAGRLIRAGWLVSEMQWYRGACGHDVYMHALYFITRKGRAAMNPKTGMSAVYARQEYEKNYRREHRDRLRAQKRAWDAEPVNKERRRAYNEKVKRAKIVIEPKPKPKMKSIEDTEHALKNAVMFEEFMAKVKREKIQ